MNIKYKIKIVIYNGGEFMIRIILNVEVGTLTELKINKIGDVLSGYFPNGVSTNNQLVASNANSQIVISPNSIQCIMNQKYDNRVSEELIKVFDLLMLEFNCANCTVVETDIMPKGEDCMILTKKKFPMLIKDTIGTGIRHFFNYDKGISEIRIEPFLNDFNSLYIEAIYNICNLNINSINDVIKSIEDDYNIRKSEIIENRF
jgi:hypothetical protein